MPGIFPPGLVLDGGEFDLQPITTSRNFIKAIWHQLTGRMEMKELGLFAVIMMLILSGCKTFEQGLLETGYRQLKGAELTKTFVGKTDYTSAGENWHYSEDGKISGVSKSGRSIDGRWKLNDAGTICIDWNDQYLPSGCSKYYINDKTGEIVWLEPDGQNSKSNLQ